jgi:hypothetical protein
MKPENGRLTVLVTFYVEIAFYYRLLKERLRGEGRRIEVKGRKGRRRRKLLDDLKERTLSLEGGSFRSQDVESYLWKRLGPVVRQTAK